MRRKLAHIALILPLVLLLGHSMTPHHHASAVDADFLLKVNHQCPSSILSDIFKFDPGIHHLENFQVSKFEVNLNFTCVPELDFSSCIAIETTPLRKGDYVVLDEVLPPKQFFEGYHPLRAPPFMLS